MIEKILGFEEGFSEKPYIDSEGFPTIGKGTKIGPNGASVDLYQFTVNEKIADLMLDKEVKGKRDHLMQMDWYLSLNADRQDIVLSMAYQMGIAGLLKFQNMIKAAKDGDYDTMADEALDSLWARQTPSRAERHAIVLRTGKLSSIKQYGE